MLELRAGVEGGSESGIVAIPGASGGSPAAHSDSATGRGLRVQACGRSVDIPPEASDGIASLRRDLARQLQLSSGAAVQVLDVAGRPLQSDEELAAAVSSGRLPLQAKLTAAALHEIEQRKLESRSKEHGFHSLQWQIVIEEVAGFSKELQGVAGELQGVKDYCGKAVREFEDQEALRREELLEQIRRETAERKSMQSDILSRLDALMQVLHSEQSAREVARYQLATQCERVSADLAAESSARAAERAEAWRELKALEQEVRVQTHRWDQLATRHNEGSQAMEMRVGELSSTSLALQQRLVLLEADAERLRLATQNTDSTVAKYHSEARAHLKLHGDELERAMQHGTLGRSRDAAQVEQECNTMLQNLGTRVTKLRDDMLKMSGEFNERVRLLETRCGASENEAAAKNEASDAKHRDVLERVHSATTVVDDLQMQHKASDLAARNVARKVEDLQERLRSAEQAVDQRVSTDHWKVQLEALTQIFRKQDLKLAQVEKEMQARFAQEASHRNASRAQLHGAMRAMTDKLADKSEVGAAGCLARAVSPSVVSTASSEPLRGRVDSRLSNGTLNTAVGSLSPHAPRRDVSPGGGTRVRTGSGAAPPGGIVRTPLTSAPRDCSPARRADGVVVGAPSVVMVQPPAATMAARVARLSAPALRSRVQSDLTGNVLLARSISPVRGAGGAVH
eukprot:TRINITY_DN27386_c0_g1_i1.p1 TRINITY_DN27386_c0_g1~~TRINITY_DN27386_c0_g1_i1.p1  ORF type:complete len:684 (+),score=205.36 TRINITY_DN27386_c0_g1_i1:840-2891(+)